MITCKFENGGEVVLRHVTVDAIIIKNGKILLGKRGTYKGRKILEFGKWGLIGGFLDPDETLEEGIKREIKEETGFEVGNIILFRIVNHPDRPAEDRQNVTFVFACNLEREDFQAVEEVTELKWFNFDELPAKEEMAFDHSESIGLYKKYLNKKHPLPIW